MKTIFALVLAIVAGSVSAQPAYPEKSVRILVGFTPGVAPDLAARMLAEKLSESLGKPVVVENVTGAGGNRSGRAFLNSAISGNSGYEVGPRAVWH